MPDRESILGDISFFSEILKKSGYKSVPFGVAEIIDNSIDAGASEVLVIGESVGNKIRQIGFLDNGSGMDREFLKKCLQVGAHFEVGSLNKRRGKFGFGLPGASAAHGNIVEVYSWQKREKGGVYKVSLNVDRLNDGIPHPQLVDGLPAPYEELRTTNTVIKRRGDVAVGPIDFKSNGTLVLWKGCERITPKTTHVLFQNHLGPDLSRLFRHFITRDPYSVERFLGCNITLVYNLEEGRECTVTPLLPNDPLYVMSDHRYVSDFSFELHNKYEKSFHLNGAEITVRFSLSPKEVRQKYKGRCKINTELGRNLGISIVREGREIDFGDFNFCDPSEDRNRFWGCEIMFTKAADDFFGVPANKQHVDMLKKAYEVEGVDEYPEDAPLEDLPIWLTLERVVGVRGVLSEFLKILRGYGSRPKPGGDSGGIIIIEGVPGETADIVDDEGEDDGDSTSGGEVSTADEVARQNALEELLSKGYDDPTEGQIERYLNHKVVLEYAAMGSSSGFMDVRLKHGLCILKINTESCFYEHVLSEIADISEDHARGVELLLLSYARCMDLHRTYESYPQFPRVLAKWNSKAEEFLHSHYDGDE